MADAPGATSLGTASCERKHRLVRRRDFRRALVVNHADADRRGLGCHRHQASSVAVGHCTADKVAEQLGNEINVS